MALKLYSFWPSSAAWRVRICLALKGQQYECIPIHLVKDGGEQFTDAYKKINPMAQVPALVVGDTILTQSMSIMEYLDEKYGGHSLLPKDLVQRAKVRELCEIVNSGIHPLQNLSILQKVGEERKVKWANNVITDGFTAIERQLEKCSGKYCVGDDITMADACLVPQVRNAVTRFEVDLKTFPNIARINDALLQHPAFKNSKPEKQPDCPNN